MAFIILSKGGCGHCVVPILCLKQQDGAIRAAFYVKDLVRSDNPCERMFLLQDRRAEELGVLGVSGTHYFT